MLSDPPPNASHPAPPFHPDRSLSSTPDASSESTSRIAISRSAIPHPTYVPPDHSKKSHARKQPHGHIARPRNAFILFRCDFVRQKKVPPDVENDHRNISRIAGSVWREMTPKDKAPWVRMAEREKEMHTKLNPGYRYSPGFGSTAAPKKKNKRGDVVAEAESILQPKKADIHSLRRSSSCPSVSDLLLEGTPSGVLDLDATSVPLNLADESQITDLSDTAKDPSDILCLCRSSSCPPGSPLAHVSFSATMHEHTISSLLATRDDLARRPSRATMYQSFAPPTATTDQAPFGSSLTGAAKISPVWPVLDRGAYALDPPGDAPGWDCAPAAPWEWTTWNELEKEPQALDHFGIAPNAPSILHDLHDLPNLASPSSIPMFTDPFGASPDSGGSTSRSFASDSDSELDPYHYNHNHNHNHNNHQHQHHNHNHAPPDQGRYPSLHLDSAMDIQLSPRVFQQDHQGQDRGGLLYPQFARLSLDRGDAPVGGA